MQGETIKFAVISLPEVTVFFFSWLFTTVIYAYIYIHFLFICVIV